MQNIGNEKGYSTAEARQILTDMKISIHGKRIVILRDDPDEKSEGGIYYAESTKIIPPAGWVLCVGDIDTKIGIGDYVFFNPGSGAEFHIPVAGKDALLITVVHQLDAFMSQAQEVD